MCSLTLFNILFKLKATTMKNNLQKTNPSISTYGLRILRVGGEAVKLYGPSTPTQPSWRVYGENVLSYFSLHFAHTFSCVLSARHYSGQLKRIT